MKRLLQLTRHRKLLLTFVVICVLALSSLTGYSLYRTFFEATATDCSAEPLILEGSDYSSNCYGAQLDYFAMQDYVFPHLVTVILFAVGTVFVGYVLWRRRVWLVSRWCILGLSFYVALVLNYVYYLWQNPVCTPGNSDTLGNIASSCLNQSASFLFAIPTYWAVLVVIILAIYLWRRQILAIRFSKRGLWLTAKSLLMAGLISYLAYGLFSIYFMSVSSSMPQEPAPPQWAFSAPEYSNASHGLYAPVDLALTIFLLYLLTMSIKSQPKRGKA